MVNQPHPPPPPPKKEGKIRHVNPATLLGRTYPSLILYREKAFCFRMLTLVVYLEWFYPAVFSPCDRMAAKSYEAGVRKYYGNRLTNISDDTTSDWIRHVYDDWASEYDKVTTISSDYDLDSVYTGADKFLDGHELARIRLSLTRDLRNRAGF